MTSASLWAWLRKLKTRLGKRWTRMLPSIRRTGRFALSCPGRLWRKVLSWTGDGWLVVATIVIALLGYWQWRYSNVLELQKLWASPEMTLRHQRLLDAQNCAYLPAVLSSDYHRQTNASLAMVEPSENYEGIEIDLPVYVEFFAEVEICINMGLCDEAMSCEKFGPQAIKLQQYYGPHLDRMRRLTREDSYTGQFTRVVEICGLGDQLRPPTKSTLNPEQLAEVKRLRREMENNGPVVARSRQACARMDPRARQSQSRPAQ